jgi:hypothetical protein
VGLPALLDPEGRARDLALALIISRVVRPGSKPATTGWWADTTLGVDLGVTDACTDEVYAAMDCLLARQDKIEATLARRHLASPANRAGMALFDLSSSWVDGRHCPLAARGYSRDGKKGREQIEYGLLTDPAGCPVAIRVFPGNTADPAAFADAVEVVRDKFGLASLTMVGDRGMITGARITALKQSGPVGWLTALRAPAIAALAATDGPLQLSLFDEQDLAEISHPDYPGERLIACRNPLLAAERARTRSDLLAATDTARCRCDRRCRSAPVFPAPGSSAACRSRKSGLLHHAAAQDQAQHVDRFVDPLATVLIRRTAPLELFGRPADPEPKTEPAADQRGD